MVASCLRNSTSASWNTLSCSRFSRSNVPMMIPSARSGTQTTERAEIFRNRFFRNRESDSRFSEKNGWSCSSTHPLRLVCTRWSCRWCRVVPSAKIVLMLWRVLGLIITIIPISAWSRDRAFSVTNRTVSSKSFWCSRMPASSIRDFRAYLFPSSGCSSGDFCDNIPITGYPVSTGCYRCEVNRSMGSNPLRIFLPVVSRTSPNCLTNFRYRGWSRIGSHSGFD